MPATIFVLTFLSKSICGRYLSSRRIREKHPTAFAPWGPLCNADGDCREDAPILNARLRHGDLESRLVLTAKGPRAAVSARWPHSLQLRCGSAPHGFLQHRPFAGGVAEYRYDYQRSARGRASNYERASERASAVCACIGAGLKQCGAPGDSSVGCGAKRLRR